jgi:hypothetical protein
MFLFIYFCILLLSDAQIALMKHLQSHGVVTQEPIATIEGEYVGFFDFPPINGQGQSSRISYTLV